MNIEKKIIIVGAGGFGREVVWTIQDCNKISKTYSIEGFLDDDESLTGKKIDGIPILGNLDWFRKNVFAVSISFTTQAICAKFSPKEDFLSTFSIESFFTC